MSFKQFISSTNKILNFCKHVYDYEQFIIVNNYSQDWLSLAGQLGNPTNLLHVVLAKTQFESCVDEKIAQGEG